MELMNSRIVHDRKKSFCFFFLLLKLKKYKGHASLIKTIIGGAQIIDMIILVVNVLKGIQTQTAECLVIGEITTKNMIIVLNKIDLLPLDDRENRIELCKKNIRAALKSTKFADCPIISTAAAVGGEKIAAVNTSASSGKRVNNVETSSSSSSSTTVEELPTPLETSEETSPSPPSASSSSSSLAATVSVTGSSTVPNMGLDHLMTTITDTVVLPSRLHEGPFYFSIDHCFPIKGQGTVITGTVLSGSVKVNDMLEFPALKLERKVKSMQMFHKNVKVAKQGDRLGICLANFDANLVK
jgi:selenocysteine-specific elongation factor